MPVYEYVALDTRGKKLKGIIDAGSLPAARQRLRDSSIYPIEVKETAGRKKENAIDGRSVGNLLNRVGIRELSAMTRQLATLLGAGLPLVQSINVMVSQTANPVLKKTLARIKEEVNEGSSLTQSMSHYPKIFSSFFINMVRAGEASGTLNIVLERLADFNESQQALRGKIRAALAYPVFMFLIGSAVLFFLIAFVVPNITRIFEEMHQTLPAITVFLIVVSRFLESFWWAIVIALAGAVVVLRYLIRNTEKGRRSWDRFKLSTPVIGTINRKMAVARFGRTLGTLLESGVPLLTSLEIAKNVVGNSRIADAVQKASDEVREGQSLSLPLARSGLFPPIATEMIGVGEQSGNLEQMLYKIADAYEKEVESNVTTMTSMLEPVMILVMGLIVGFIVVSILLPIFEMNQLVR
ncbi:MAG TPA: type II secretion system inner membrane protein GspF [Syntrophales bacterium]|jgi:general secretion pathway protein F|nr:type II secretion system inner membrane protein GspF [Syntrophales bacterium]HRT61275.1 type II secretion system inner membrane protein GspF [Syntrophales bacterium]